MRDAFRSQLAQISKKNLSLNISQRILFRFRFRERSIVESTLGGAPLGFSASLGALRSPLSHRGQDVKAGGGERHGRKILRCLDSLGSDLVEGEGGGGGNNEKPRVISRPAWCLLDSK